MGHSNMLTTNSIISTKDHGTKMMIDKMPPNSAQSKVANSSTVTGMIRINEKGKGEFVAFSGNKITIGRSRSCDLKLFSASCSSRHAEIKVENNSCVLNDLNSTNGSSVNGEDVVRHILADGDKLSFGTERFVFLEQYMQTNNSSNSLTVEETVRSGPVVQIGSRRVSPQATPSSKKIKLMIMSGPRAGQNIDITYPKQGLSIGRPGHQLLNLTLESHGYVASTIRHGADSVVDSEILLNDSPLGSSSQVIENGDSLVVANVEFMVVFPSRVAKTRKS